MISGFQVWWSIKAAWRLKDYEPSPVTVLSLLRWARQFPPEFRSDLLRLATGIRFVTRQEVVQSLLELNSRVIAALRKDGVGYDRVIYVTTDSAGSSSGVMLNMLRDRGNLERKGVKFLDSRDARGIREMTTELGHGALIYVDDFAGTGKQFTRSRTRAAQYVVGTFSEFLLLPCICEEAIDRVAGSGVVPLAGFTHEKSDRPLRAECSDLSADCREALINLSVEKFRDRRVSLGFDGLATNVVLYRNAPNTTPLIFRGNLRQTPIRGIVPRWDDLD